MWGVYFKGMDMLVQLSMIWSINRFSKRLKRAGYLNQSFNRFMYSSYCFVWFTELSHVLVVSCYSIRFVELFMS